MGWAEKELKRAKLKKKIDEVMKSPEYYEGEPERWESNEKAYELFKSIWCGKWGIW